MDDKSGKRLWTGPIDAMDVRTMPDRIAQEIRLAILRGDVRPGEALRQRELAKRFGTSLIPVREALRCLERENLVSTHPYRGACVLLLSADEIRQVSYLHHVLFTHTLSYALPASGPADADRVAAVLAELANEREPVQCHRLLWGFYSGMLEPSQRAHDIEMLRGIWLRYMRYWPLVWKVLNIGEFSAPTLDDTIQAYRAKDLARMVAQSASRTEEFVRLVVSELAAAQAMTSAENLDAAAEPVSDRPRAPRRPRA